MGVIDINVDDRDTINYHTDVNNIKKYKEFLVSLQAENINSKVLNIGGGRYLIQLPVIICTGSDVLSYFQIPFMHSLEKMHIKHTDLNDINSKDKFTYLVSHHHHKNILIDIFSVINTVSPDLIDEYIGFFHDMGQYRIITNSTNTDLIYISVNIKIVGD